MTAQEVTVVTVSVSVSADEVSRGSVSERGVVTESPVPVTSSLTQDECGFPLSVFTNVRSTL